MNQVVWLKATYQLRQVYKNIHTQRELCKEIPVISSVPDFIISAPQLKQTGLWKTSSRTSNKTCLAKLVLGKICFLKNREQTNKSTE